MARCGQGVTQRAYNDGWPMDHASEIFETHAARVAPLSRHAVSFNGLVDSCTVTAAVGRVARERATAEGGTARSHLLIGGPIS